MQYLWLYGALRDVVKDLNDKGEIYEATFDLAVGEDGFLSLVEHGEGLKGVLMPVCEEICTIFDALSVKWQLIDDARGIYAPVSSSPVKSQNENDVDWFAARLLAVLASLKLATSSHRRTIAIGWQYRVAAYWLAQIDEKNLQGSAQSFEIEKLEVPSAGFYNLETYFYQHERFQGGASSTLRREIIASGDGVFILPYDPRLDKVLLIEQVRPGPMARGAKTVNALEVIAGLIGIGETPEYTARREAEEEAGVSVKRVIQLPGAYQSPGLATQYGYAFIGEVDLLDVKEGVFGLPEEGEDIRTRCFDYQELVKLFDAGQANNAPLQICVLNLMRHREMLQREWAKCA